MRVKAGVRVDLAVGAVRAAVTENSAVCPDAKTVILWKVAGLFVGDLAGRFRFQNAYAAKFPFTLEHLVRGYSRSSVCMSPRSAGTSVCVPSKSGTTITGSWNMFISDNRVLLEFRDIPANGLMFSGSFGWNTRT